MLFEDWANESRDNDPTAESDNFDDEDQHFDSSFQAPAVIGEEDDQPRFAVQRLDWNPSIEHGEVITISIGSEQLLIGTEKNHVLRWNTETDEFSGTSSSSFFFFVLV